MAIPQIDGRRRRSERSREAIVQSILDLVGEQVLEPTAQQIAGRAGVDITTVFRHFSDMLKPLLWKPPERLVNTTIRSISSRPVASREN